MLNDFFPKKTDKDLYLARRLVNESIIENKNFGNVDVGDNLWGCGPQENRTWKWTLHSFSFLDPLINVGEYSFVVEVVKSWIEEFSSCSIEEDFPWHDHATSLRLDRLSRIAIEFSDNQFSDLACLHADLLLRESFYSRNTNHGFDQAVSLLLASLAFSFESNANQWRSVGLERLRNEISFAFTSEGVHVENSPAYHMGMIGNLVRARRILKIIDTDNNDFDCLFDKALQYLIWISRPDRFLTYLGDSASYRPSVSQELTHLPFAPMVEWVASAGKTGKKPVGNFKVYEQSGYAMYRSSWDRWPGHTHIVFKNGFLSRYHRQDDDLNVLLHAFGEDWLIDSGLYNHNQKDPIRVYMRSVKAHNVPYIPSVRMDRENYGRDFSRLIPLELDGYRYAVEGVTSMYSCGKVSRRLLIKNSNLFEISDSFFGFSGKEKYWMFHFPIDKKIIISDREVLIHGKNKTLSLRCDLSCMPVFISRGLGKKFPSAQSVKINQMEDSFVVVFGPSIEDEVKFIFSFLN